MTRSCEAWICIPANHPSLPGHFPGAPIVPAVVLLDQVVDAAERKLERALHITGLPQVKFVAPLLPEQRALCALTLQGSRMSFRVEQAGRLVARGTFALAAAPALPSEDAP